MPCQGVNGQPPQACATEPAVSDCNTALPLRSGILVSGPPVRSQAVLFVSPDAVVTGTAFCYVMISRAVVIYYSSLLLSCSDGFGHLLA